jgi:hypothetical protein
MNKRADRTQTHHIAEKCSKKHVRFYVFEAPRANLTMGPYDYVYV